MHSQTPRYFRVSPKFWTDPEVEKWDDQAKLLALYLLTCPQRTTEGLFPFRKAYALADLGWDSERFREAFEELLANRFIEYDDDARVILIVNALRYQAPENENQAKNAVKRLLNLPATPLTCTFRTLCERFSERLLEQLPEGFGKGMPNPPETSSSNSSSITQAQSQTRAPSPSRGSDDEDELRAHFENQGFDRTDIDAALDRLRLRAAGFGSPVSDWLAWLQKTLPDMQRVREQSNGSHDRRALVDGEELIYRDGEWLALATCECGNKIRPGHYCAECGFQAMEAAS